MYDDEEAEIGIKLDIRSNTKHAPLVAAAAAGDVSLCLRLLKEDAEFDEQGIIANYTAEDGITPLYAACCNGHYRCAYELVNNAPAIDINKPDSRQQTPIYVACANGHKECVELLLNLEADVMRTNDRGRNPLHAAARYGHAWLIPVLVEFQSKLMFVNDRDGSTPLHLAAMNGKTKTVENLLNWGADLYPRDEIGRTPLSLAAQHGHSEVVDIILSCITQEEGSDSSEEEEEKEEDEEERNREKAERIKRVVNMEDEEGRTAMHWACMNGHAYVARMLYGSGSDADAKDKEQTTPLHLACLNGHEDCVEALVVDCNASLKEIDSKGRGVIHAAAVRVSAKNCIKFLIKETASIEKKKQEDSGEKGEGDGGVAAVLDLLCSKDSANNTPLHIAAATGNAVGLKVMAKRARKLLEKLRKKLSKEREKNERDNAAATARAEVPHLFDAVDRFGRTPMHLAVTLGKNVPECLEVLLEYGVEDAPPLEKEDAEGDTPFMAACKYSATKCMEIMFKKDPRVLRRVNRLRRNPLHCAALSGQHESVEWLLEKDEAVMLVDKEISGGAPSDDGRTPSRERRRSKHATSPRRRRGQVPVSGCVAG